MSREIKIFATLAVPAAFRDDFGARVYNKEPLDRVINRIRQELEQAIASTDGKTFSIELSICSNTE